MILARWKQLYRIEKDMQSLPRLVQISVPDTYGYDFSRTARSLVMNPRKPYH